jgi:hypothetical protein
MRISPKVSGEIFDIVQLRHGERNVFLIVVVENRSDRKAVAFSAKDSKLTAPCQDAITVFLA